MERHLVDIDGHIAIVDRFPFVCHAKQVDRTCRRMSTDKWMTFPQTKKIRLRSGIVLVEKLSNPRHHFWRHPDT